MPATNSAPERKTTRPLLLAGGKSSRMGSPKHLLVRPSGQVAYRHAIRLLHLAVPEAERVYISVRDEGQVGDFDGAEEGEIDIRFIFDRDGVGNEGEGEGAIDVGPAAGLLAAHAHDTDAHWLVLACDHPLITVEALQQLHEEFEEPVTCFVNREGFVEPLVAVWGPEALERLKGSAGSAVGPSRVVREVGGKMIVPRMTEWVVGVNTVVEWERAKRVLERMGMEMTDESGKGEGDVGCH
jgi:molybdopterin-guanine dinucleotide biosynthesis protein A